MRLSKASIVIDPARAFGQPITAQFGVPTAVLADAIESESSIARVAHIFDVSRASVRDAVAFERTLAEP